jgi:hypothetical protein
MYNEQSSYYYNPLLISVANEMDIFTEYFSHAIKMCAEAKVSEYLDLNHYTQKKSVHKCRAFLRNDIKKPFEFSVCLN